MNTAKRKTAALTIKTKYNSMTLEQKFTEMTKLSNCIEQCSKCASFMCIVHTVTMSVHITIQCHVNLNFSKTQQTSIITIVHSVEQCCEICATFHFNFLLQGFRSKLLKVCKSSVIKSNVATYHSFTNPAYICRIKVYFEDKFKLTSMLLNIFVQFMLIAVEESLLATYIYQRCTN